METAVADPLLGSKLDKYRVEKRIGSGGMGVVYSGTHSWTERPVAIKVLHAILRPGAADARRFLREARAAAALQHPNVVDVLDMGQDDAGRVYLVMELLAGRSLRALLQETPRLPLSEALGFLVPIIDALARAHELGIIHRDIKPDNVFLAAEHGGLVPKLLDFGVAKLLDCAPSGPTESGALLGTPRYMAPEQISGEPTLGPAADIWGMGMLLFECLAGRLPFEASPSLPALLLKRTTEDAASLSVYRPELPAGVSAAIARALQRSPVARFSSMRELASALTAAADQAPGDLEALQPPAAQSGGKSRLPLRRRTLWRTTFALVAAAPLGWALVAGSRSGEDGAEPSSKQAVVQSQQVAADPALPSGTAAQPLATLPARVEDMAALTPQPSAASVSPSAAPSVRRAATRRASARSTPPAGAAGGAAGTTTPAQAEASAPPSRADADAVGAQAPPDIIPEFE